VANLYHQEFQGILIALGVISSVEDETGARICTVFPNPAHGTLSIRWESAAAPGELVLRDLSGREVLRSMLGNGITRIPLDGVATGVYTAAVDGQGLPTRIVVE
jgi:hypothetical protein